MSSDNTSELSSLEYSTTETTTDYTDSEQQNIDLNGDILENYNIITELGSGAYSRVWLGYNIQDLKYYAIKVQNSDDYEDGKDEIKILKKISNRCGQINKIIHTFTESRFVENKIEKFPCSVYELCAGNLDALGRKGKYKSGYPIKMVKNIFKQLCKAVAFLHNEMKIFHGDIKPDNILLCGINNRDKRYIKMYDNCDFHNLYKQVKNQYWEKKGKNIKNIKKMDIDTRLKIRKKIHSSLIDNIDGYKDLKYKVDEKYLNDVKIKLTDFGHFCPDEDVMEDDFGTKYYQAPEIVLMGDCKNKVDIWALGCTLYELLTGKILFDPKKNRYQNEDYNHLKMFIELCGNFNRDRLLSTKFYREFFDKKGNLRDFNLKDKRDFKKKMTERIKKDGLNEDVDMVVDLLSNMIKLSSHKRYNINEVLDHK
jgi:serine/threonine protein kinase